MDFSITSQAASAETHVRGLRSFCGDSGILIAGGAELTPATADSLKYRKRTISSRIRATQANTTDLKLTTASFVICERAFFLCSFRWTRSICVMNFSTSDNGRRPLLKSLLFKLAPYCSKEGLSERWQSTDPTIHNAISCQFEAVIRIGRSVLRPLGCDEMCNVNQESMRKLGQGVQP